MLNHKKLAKKPKLFLSMTGVTPGQFYDLCPEIESQYKDNGRKDASPGITESETSAQGAGSNTAAGTES